MKTQLLAGASAFWEQAQQDIAAARRRVLLEAMTFEGDAAGLSAAGALARSVASDRRVLVDDYTRLTVSDRWVGGGGGSSRLSPELAEEVAATRRMFQDLLSAGVRVRVTNPIRPSLLNYAARNHKKLVVADDVAFLGGVNFSDHNFLWDDLMVRIDDADAAQALADDFDATWASRARRWRLQSNGVTLLGLDGRNNARDLAEIEDRLSRAQSEIVLVSPYATRPFLDSLAAAARRGVRVKVITPWASNKRTVRDALIGYCRRQGLQLRLLDRMSHLKGLAIDGQTLILGSANFDVVSLRAEEELIAILDDAQLTQVFLDQIVAPLLAGPEPSGPLAGVRSRFAEGLLSAASLAARLASSYPRRAVDFDWRA